ncbi:FAD/NAD(P)-binding protein [Streptomyces sp. NPDC018045]|uniref:FAD/NAD(P)-binding protein n=1 Tax=Streptomyces sp. NPDC018045 TaxID=3365037 RepID=UPI0037946962
MVSHEHPSRPPVFAIIGVGPRGLGVLERLVGHCAARPFPVTVHLVDPRPAGPGFHLADQPDHLLLNTVCSQVTAFADARMVDGPTATSGPGLHEWCRSRDLRIAADGHTVRTGEGREIEPNDYLPRRLLHDYLAWAAGRIRAAAPGTMRLIEHRSAALDIRPGAPERESVLLADGTVIDADAVFVTVGHHWLYHPEQAIAEPRLVSRPYPLPDVLDCIAPGERVAVLGMGLTAMDVIASLTLGRGGRHEKAGGGDGGGGSAEARGARLRYVPSGREPVIVLANRTGLPSCSRPHLNPGRLRFVPLALTVAELDARRAVRPGGRLDFAGDVLPLVEAEMELAYYRAVLGNQVDDFAAAGTEFARRAEHAGWRALLAESRERYGPYPLRGVLDAPAAERQWAGPEEYARWFAAQVAEDLDDARTGLGRSPRKEALEVLRDHRDVLRAAVDPPGLDETSLDRFFGVFTSTVNRLVIGPQLDRSAELLSLLDAGVLRLGPGPRPKVLAPAGSAAPWRLESTCLERPETVEVDHVVAAHVAEPPADQVPGSLLGTLVAAGRIATLAPHGGSATGLHVTRDGRGIDPDGTVQPRLYFLGPHTEGSSYYNHYVPSPGAPSRALMDAELALRTALDPLTARP